MPVWLQALALAALVWLAYWNSLQVPFQFDDWHVIPENPSVRGPADIPSFFTDISTFSVLPGTRDYRPVFLTSMALAWWVGGGSTLPFHIVSVLLHTCCVLLAFSIFRKIFLHPEAVRSFGNAGWVAWGGAALFALHPLATESIVYISSQSVPLAAVFYLTSFRLFLAVYAGAGTGDARRTRLLRAGSYLAYALALMSKPIAITLPINLLSWEILLASRPRRSHLAQRLGKYWPFVAISAGFILLRSQIMTTPFGGGPARPVVEHLLTQTRALVEYYLASALVPLGLNVDPDFPTSTSIIDARLLLAILVLGGLAWLLYRFRGQRTVVFWSLWVPICISLTTYGVIIGQVISEHRVYLSLVGFSAVVVLLIARLKIFVEKRSLASARLAVTVLIVLLMSFYGYQTYRRNEVWSSKLTLWEDSVAHQGSWRAHMNYALALEENGRDEEALTYYEKALELGPYATAYTNLGLAYVKHGEVERGLAHLRTAVELVPSSADAHRFLAFGLTRMGDTDGAEAELRQAVVLRPGYIEALDELAVIYKQKQQYGLAAEAYRRILEIDPAERWAEDALRSAEEMDGDSAPSIYAEEEIRQGRYGDAVEILERARVENPADPDLLFALGFSYQMLADSNQMSTDRDEATQAYEELLDVSPGHVQGTFNLAYLFLEAVDREDLSRSVNLFQRVLELDPDYDEALFHLGTVHRLLGETERGADYDRDYIERGTNESLVERSRERLEIIGPQS